MSVSVCAGTGLEEMPGANELCRILCYRNSNRESATGWQVRKGIMVLLCFEGWGNLEIPRGEGRALRWELHEQNSGAQIYQGVWRIECRRSFWEMIKW